MFTSVHAPRVHEHIVAQIERGILEGRLRDGDKLPPERELVRQFRASRVAVREALRVLQHRGLVGVRHGSAGGHFVREADAAPVCRDLGSLLRRCRVSPAHVAEARLAIEPELARLAALRATDVDVKSLTACVEAGAGDGDREFHRLVAAAAGNPVHAVLTDVLVALDIATPAAGEPAVHEAESDGAHRAILAAIAARRPDEARAAMTAHILASQARAERLRAASRGA